MPTTTKIDLIKAVQQVGDETPYKVLNTLPKPTLMERLTGLTKAAREERRKVGLAKMAPIDGMLPCTRCGEWKPLDNFAKSGKEIYQVRHGRQIWCGTRKHPGCVQEHRAHRRLHPWPNRQAPAARRRALEAVK